MPQSARQGDSVATGHGCDTITVLAAPSQGSVFINGILACRLGDLTVSHDVLVSAVCTPHIAPISGSSSSVYIAGAKAARLGDACDAGSITTGSSNVYIGD
jgi:uncharacterized Zn-binding protein involved in type VI secretion